MRIVEIDPRSRSFKLTLTEAQLLEFWLACNESGLCSGTTWALLSEALDEMGIATPDG